MMVVEKARKWLLFSFLYDNLTSDIITENSVNKRSNLMQQNADIYVLQSHSTCFGRHSARHQEY